MAGIGSKLEAAASSIAAKALLSAKTVLQEGPQLHHPLGNDPDQRQAATLQRTFSWKDQREHFDVLNASADQGAGVPPLTCNLQRHVEDNTWIDRHASLNVGTPGNDQTGHPRH